MDDNTLMVSNGSSTSADTSSQSSIVTPLLISAAGVVGTLFIIFTYHILIAKFCLRRRQPATTNGTGGEKGVGERVLGAIPIMTYCREKQINGEARTTELPEDCVICIGELEEGETVRLLPSCGHVFHVGCVDHWFSAHSSCPTCRASVIPVNPLSTCASQAADVEDYSVGDSIIGVGDGDGVVVRNQPFLKVKRSLSMDDICYKISFEDQWHNQERADCIETFVSSYIPSPGSILIDKRNT
ncbi:RING-H2 finger protein ATL1 [Linum grandiflorum]